MKRTRIIAFLLMLICIGLQAQSVKNGSRWTDGMTVYEAVNHGNLIKFTGGTSHEGGYQFTLSKVSEGKYLLQSYNKEGDVSLRGDDSGYKVDLIIDVENSRQFLVVRDVRGQAVDLLYKDDVDSAYNIMANDLLSMLMGTYKDESGDTYLFDFGRCKFGNGSQETDYELCSEFDMPSNTFRAYGKYWTFEFTVDGIDLFKAQYNSEEDVYVRGDLIKHLTYQDIGNGRWPFTANSVVTRSKLRYYSPEELRLMRNEIMARHGYSFSSLDLQQHFGMKSWYHPLNDNNHIHLSLGEVLNVELIKAEENDRDVEEQKMEESVTNYEVTVENEKQFLDELGSNRTIYIASNTTLNLSKILEYPDLCRKYGIGMTDNASNSDFNVLSEEVFDGRQLTLKNIENLSIVGQTGSQIVVEPRYARVLNFLFCHNIVLRNLTIGHTQEGYCEGGVIMTDNCSNIKIESCDLYGCGTYGIEAAYTKDLRCVRTIIRDCSYGIMTLHNDFNVWFIDCDFYRCRQFSLIDVGTDCINVDFSNCRFAQNNGTLFGLRSNITLTN